MYLSTQLKDLIQNKKAECLPNKSKHSTDEKLKGAGCNQTIFEEAAIEAILNATDGTPRLINTVMQAYS